MLTLPTVNLQAYKRTRNRQTSKTIIQLKEIYFGSAKKKKKKNRNKKKQQQQQKNWQTNAKKQNKKQKQIETKQKQFKTNKLRLLNGNCSFT